MPNICTGGGGRVDTNRRILANEALFQGNTQLLFFSQVDPKFLAKLISFFKKTFIGAEFLEKGQYQYILRTPAQITWALCQKLKSRIIARTWIVLGSNSLFRLHVANVIKTNLIWSTLCFWISCCSCKLWKLCPNLSPQQTHNITCHFSKLTIDQLAVYYITRATRA